MKKKSTPLPTADKFFKDEFKIAQEAMPAIWYDLKLKAIHFAKLHVKAALKAAADKATAKIELEYDDQPSSSIPPYEYPVVNKKSILTAYPEELIK